MLQGIKNFGGSRFLEFGVLMKMSFLKRIEDVLEQGFEVSRKMLERAREGARDLGEKGALKLEIMQLERQSTRLLAQLGAEVYYTFTKRNQVTVSKNTKGMKYLVTDIERIEKSISEKKLILDKLNSTKEESIN